LTNNSTAPVTISNFPATYGIFRVMIKPFEPTETNGAYLFGLKNVRYDKSGNIQSWGITVHKDMWKYLRASMLHKLVVPIIEYVDVDLGKAQILWESAVVEIRHKILPWYYCISYKLSPQNTEIVLRRDSDTDLEINFEEDELYTFIIHDPGIVKNGDGIK